MLMLCMCGCVKFTGEAPVDLAKPCTRGQAPQAALQVMCRAHTPYRAGGGGAACVREWQVTGVILYRAGSGVGVSAIRVCPYPNVQSLLESLLHPRKSIHVKSVCLCV